MLGACLDSKVDIQKSGATKSLLTSLSEEIVVLFIASLR